MHVEDNSVGLFFHLCPSGYCRCYFNTSIGISSCANVYVNSDPDRQCVCERKGKWITFPFGKPDSLSIIGILCGECKNKLGVSVLLNECVSCDKTNIILIPALGNNTNTHIYRYIISSLEFIIFYIGPCQTINQIDNVF